MITLFVGPTLGRDEIDIAGPIEVLPPAAQGDVYRAALRRPRVIGIIDGYFQGKLSVWHKEILWAMSQGIHVFGASSMGALRAAELHAFGMRGVGRIFEAYRDGDIEADDEVALLHGPEEAGYAQVSEPMVNVRATLDAAENAGIIDAGFSALVCRTAKNTFYHALSWESLLTDPAVREYDPAQLARLRDWLPEGRIDAKRDDALEMLKVIEAFVASDPKPKSVDFGFEWTHLWDAVTETVAAEDPQFATTDGISAVEILDELRLTPDVYRRFRREALLHTLAVKESHVRDASLDNRALRDSMAEFRLANGLLSKGELVSWLAERAMTLEELEQFVEAGLRTEKLLADADLTGPMLALLKTSMEFTPLVERARRKRDVLKKLDNQVSLQNELGIAKLQILAWYFESRLRQTIPDDLNKFIETLDLFDVERFYEMIVKEYVTVENTDL